MNSTPFHILSLTPGAEVRCPSPLSRVLWRRRRTPPPLLLGLRAFLYRPYQTRAQIAMGVCYVLCVRSSVTWTVPLPIEQLFVTAGHGKKEIAKNMSLSGSGRQYLGRTSFRGGPYQARPRKPGRPKVSLRLFFLRRTLLLHHLHALLPEGPCSQVPRHLPPGSFGGGAGPGITLSLRQDVPSLLGLMTDR